MDFGQPNAKIGQKMANDRLLFLALLFVCIILFVCLSVCAHACTYICVNVSLCVFLCVSVYVCVCLCMCMCLYIQVGICQFKMSNHYIILIPLLFIFCLYQPSSRNSIHHFCVVPESPQLPHKLQILSCKTHAKPRDKVHIKSANTYRHILYICC